jgi:hypothetical protein
MSALSILLESGPLGTISGESLKKASGLVEDRGAGKLRSPFYDA